MKTRELLTAAEVGELHASLERRLAKVGLATQPEVAMRVLDLASKPDAQVSDYAKILKTDPALTGRLLRLANSAYFAQRQPTTAIERACVLLGLDRLKAVSLGFYLSQAAAGDPNNALSRRVWGESVFRACIASEMAKIACPRNVSEAFVIGLMMDAGVPLMGKLLGTSAMDVLGSTAPPAKRFKEEMRQFEFTHVDVMAVLCARWRLPELLSKPIEWHHLPPGETTKTDVVYKLQRIAFYAGTLDLDTTTHEPKQAAPLPLIAERTLGLNSDQVAKVASEACSECRTIMQLFTHIADSVIEQGDIAVRANMQLCELIERHVIVGEADVTTADFRLGGMLIHVARDPAGPIAYLHGSQGEWIASQRIEPGCDILTKLREGFGLEAHPTDETQKIVECIGRLAA
jgi:HD-like signal output (HDOD) protein